MTFEKFSEIAIYGAQAVTALWGAFCVVMILMRTSQKAFSSEETQLQFLDELEKPLKMGDVQGAIQMCEGDQRAVPQLAHLALTHRELGYAKIRQLLLDRFHRDVLSDLDIRISWVNTVIKTAPMLGLFGTVVGMMLAFGKLAAAEHVKADALANDISLALITTVVGLSVAIPLIIALANCNIQIRSLEEGVSSGLTRFLEIFRDTVSKQPVR